MDQKQTMEASCGPELPEFMGREPLSPERGAQIWA